MKTIDARGISCPEPLLMLKAALKNQKELLLMVDSKNALENCKDYAQQVGADVTVAQKGEEYHLTVKAKG